MTAAETRAGLRAFAEPVSRRRVFIYGINYAPEPTGVGRYTGEIGTYLVDQGVKVEVVTAAPHYPGWAVRDGYRNRYRVEYLAGVRITRCPLLLKRNMRNIWRLVAPLTFALSSAPVAIWRILRTRPDTVLCIEPTLLCAPAALLAAKIVRAKVVLHVQDLEIDAAFAVGHLRGKFFQKLALMFERAILGGFDAIVTISGRMQSHLESRGIAPQRLSLVRNWVDLQKIKPLNRSSAYRQDLGIRDGSFIALYAGNIGAKQALEVVLDAARQSTAEVIFVIVGEGPEKQRLEARYGDLSNVRFLPVQPEERLGELLNFADVHLLPQEQDAADLVLPSKLGGMLASGKPSIVMANPETELFDFLGDGAIIIPPGDSLALVEAIQSVIHNNAPVKLENNGARIAALDAKHILPAFRAILASEK